MGRRRAARAISMSDGTALMSDLRCSLRQSARPRGVLHFPLRHAPPQSGGCMTVLFERIWLLAALWPISPESFSSGQ
jgi:hypothetical protein